MKEERSGTPIRRCDSQQSVVFDVRHGEEGARSCIASPSLSS
jgi:hypothetical protein